MRHSIYTGSTSADCQTYAENGTKMVLLRFSNYHGRAPISCGVDLSPEHAREFAQHLIECADALEQEAA